MNKLIICLFNESKLNKKFGQENTSPGRRNPKTTTILKFLTWFLTVKVLSQKYFVSKT